MKAYLPPVVALSCVLVLVSACADTREDLTWAKAVKDSGWSDLAPDLTAADAMAMVKDLRAYSDRDFLERAYGLLLARDPEYAYALGISRSYGVPEDELTDVSDEHALGTRELCLALLAETEGRLVALSGDSASSADSALYLASFERWLSDKARDIEFSIDKYPVSPYVNSLDQLAVAYFSEYRNVRTEDEARRFIACLEKLPRKMAGLVEALDRRTAAGIALPRGVYERALLGVRSVAYSTPQGSPFYEAFARKLASSSVPARKRPALLNEVAAAVEASALPAWRRLEEAMERQAQAARDEGGASRLPGGTEYYAACLSRLTTTGLGAEEIHKQGLAETARLVAEIRSGFAALGYPEGDSLAELYDRLGGDTGSLSGDDLLLRTNGLVTRMDARLGMVVRKPPSAKVEVVYGPMGGYYQPPSADGARPGRYFVEEGARLPVYDIASTVYHETVPGHHLQVARSLEADLPGFMRASDFLAYTEGWALYAELLASEMGVYEDDAAGNLGRLRMEALRAARLAADTGINAMGWKRSEAYAFLKDNTGLGDGMIEADIARYVVDPGQAVTYYLGFLRILELRELSRSRLGTRFDLRDFDEAVLAHGALPLDILSTVVEAYIAEKAAPVGQKP